MFVRHLCRMSSCHRGLVEGQDQAAESYLLTTSQDTAAGLTRRDQAVDCNVCEVRISSAKDARELDGKQVSGKSHVLQPTESCGGRSRSITSVNKCESNRHSRTADYVWSLSASSVTSHEKEKVPIGSDVLQTTAASVRAVDSACHPPAIDSTQTSTATDGFTQQQRINNVRHPPAIDSTQMSTATDGFTQQQRINNVRHPPAIDSTQTSTATDGFTRQQRINSNWQECLSDMSEVGTDTMTSNEATGRPYINTETRSHTETRSKRSGCGRGLLNFRHLPAAQMASRGKSSDRAGYGGGSADMSHGVDTGQVTPSLENFIDADTDVSSRVTQTASHAEHSALLCPLTDRHVGVTSHCSGGVDDGGCLNATSDSQTDKQHSAVHGVQSSVSSSGSSLSRPPLPPPPGITQPASASLPATGPVPLMPVHPHMMPYTWPPTAPLCGGILSPAVQPVPPGFAPATAAFVGQTLSMPYSSLPVYPAYGYQMMPGSWPFLPPPFCSLPADETATNADVDKVD